MSIKIISADEAAGLIRDGDVVIAGGNGGMAPEAIYAAIERRFIESGGPRDLTLMHTTGIGAADASGRGLDHFAHDGLVRRVIGGNYGLQLRFMKTLVVTGAVEAYNLPQGVMAQLYRAMAAKQPGVITHVGLHTYMDPREEGGRMNTAAQEELVERIELAGAEWLFYKAPVPQVAFIRGTTADEDGYVSMEHEPTTREELSIAMAAHNAGGTVVCQVERVTRRGALSPHMVRVPGFLIDYIVVEPEQWQTFGVRFEASLCGETPAPPMTLQDIPSLDVRRFIARRAAVELREGDVINLGVGVSAGIADVAEEEGIIDLITLTVEAGVIGGIPGSGLMFGSSRNPRAIIDQPYQFDFYDGGGLDAAFLSFAEVGADGSVNVTRFGDRNDGAGGFINISQNAKRLVFSGTFTAVGLELAFEKGKVLIKAEGRVKKFIPRVGQISYNGLRGRERGQPVRFVTERAVFDLDDEGLVLVEIAPGVRLQEDVLNQVDFDLKVHSDLREMDGRLFREGPMGLKTSVVSR